MKITNKKMFIRGILLLLLAVGIGISRFCIFTEATHGIPKAVIGIGICLLAAFYHMVMACILTARTRERRKNNYAIIWRKG